jgi:hypothetical protein
MSRTPARFTQADVARALRAIDQTGGDKEVVIEPDGRIRIVPAAKTSGEDRSEEDHDYPYSVDNEREIRL